jgi:VWFA-related protein
MRWPLLAAVLIATAAQAQLTRTLERIEVSVIEVDVVVLDTQGKPVSGLSSKDFELRVRGRKRPITNFYEVNRRADETRATTKASQGEPVARRDYLVLFIDDLHLNQHEKKRALDALRTFVGQHVRPGTAAMLVASEGDVRILERFTEDSSRLMRAIDAIERQPARVSEYERERRDLLNLIDVVRNDPNPDFREHMGDILRRQIDSLAQHERVMVEGTIAALDHVSNAVAGLDGRRVMVYVSDGLPMQPGAEVFQYYKPDEFVGKDPTANRIMAQSQSLDAMSTNLSSRFRDLARQAAFTGVQFFAIDARGVQGFDERVENSAASSRLDSSLIRANLHGPIQLLADETGGQAIIDTNDMGIAFAKLDEHLSTYYSLGFRSEGSGREDDINVNVKRRGLTVRAVKHVRQRSTREQIADRVRASLYARIEENPLDAKVALTHLPGPQLKATIRVPLAKLSILPGRDRAETSFALFLAMMDQDMRETPVRMFVHRVVPSEFEESTQSVTFDIQPGMYIVSMAVTDGYSLQASYLQREVSILSK